MASTNVSLLIGHRQRTYALFLSEEKCIFFGQNRHFFRRKNNFVRTKWTFLPFRGPDFTSICLFSQNNTLSKSSKSRNIDTKSSFFLTFFQTVFDIKFTIHFKFPELVPSPESAYLRSQMSYRMKILITACKMTLLSFLAVAQTMAQDSVKDSASYLDNNFYNKTQRLTDKIIQSKAFQMTYIGNISYVAYFIS